MAPARSSAQPGSVASTLPAAVLWDMDGTLVDTEPYWIAEERALVELHGGVWTDEHAYQLVGNDLMVSAQYIIDHAPIPLTPVEVVHELLAGVVRRVSEHVPWRPGAWELLEALGEQLQARKEELTDEKPPQRRVG